MHEMKDKNLYNHLINEISPISNPGNQSTNKTIFFLCQESRKDISC